MQDNRNDSSLKPRDIAVAHLLLRLLVGVIFLNFGIGKIVNIPAFVERMVKTLEASYIPANLVRLGAYPVPIIELVVGLLMGLKQNQAQIKPKSA